VIIVLYKGGVMTSKNYHTKGHEIKLLFHQITFNKCLELRLISLKILLYSQNLFVEKK
jgi:hypothetical protein